MVQQKNGYCILIFGVLSFHIISLKIATARQESLKFDSDFAQTFVADNIWLQLQWPMRRNLYFSN